MLGSRSIYHAGWKATTDHISTGVMDEEELAVGSRRFEEDHWELFDLRSDFSESTDRPNDTRRGCRRLQELWSAEAGRNQVFPVDDTFINRIGAFIPSAWPPGPSRTYLPGGGPVSDESIPATGEAMPRAAARGLATRRGIATGDTRNIVRTRWRGKQAASYAGGVRAYAAP